MAPTPIPLSFLRKLIRLTWSDIAWGLRVGWLCPADVIEHAVSSLSEGQDVGSATLEMAGLSQFELGRVPVLLGKILDESGAMNDGESSRRWLFLLLSWFFERRNQSQDPLGVVEELYADFGYPEAIRGFVRYMPPEDRYEPQAYTAAENEARLFEKWEQYLHSFPERRSQ